MLPILVLAMVIIFIYAYFPKKEDSINGKL